MIEYGRPRRVVDDGTFSTAQAAEILGVTRRRVQALIKSRRATERKRGGVKMDAELPDYITSPEAQKLLGVNRQRISALLKTGQLRGKKDGRRWRIERASVEERLKALRK